jgi:hypothetical protein
MKQIVIISQSADSAITTDVLLQIGEALTLQNAEDFAPKWDGVKGPDGIAIDAKATFSVAQADAGIPANAIPLLIQDTIDGGAGVLGFHDVEDGSIPVIRIGWGAIKANGGTLLSGSNSLSTTCSHEACELLADISANNWVTKADGKTKEAYEACDGVEGNSYTKQVQATPSGALPAQPVAVSNFLTPAWFVLGSQGPWDFLGKTTGPQTKDAGGYEIDENPDGSITNDFARTVEDGGMPAWRREVIAAKHETPGTRHHKRKHGRRYKLEKGETILTTEHGHVHCLADGTVLLRSSHGTLRMDAAGFHITAPNGVELHERMGRLSSKLHDVKEIATDIEAAAKDVLTGEGDGALADAAARVDDAKAAAKDLVGETPAKPKETP